MKHIDRFLRQQAVNARVDSFNELVKRQKQAHREAHRTWVLAVIAAFVALTLTCAGTVLVITGAALPIEAIGGPLAALISGTLMLLHRRHLQHEKELVELIRRVTQPVSDDSPGDLPTAA